MNQVFDFQRWLLLVGKHWSENRKKYLLSLAAIVALMVIWYSFILLIERYHPYPEEMQTATYFVGMAITGCLFGSLFFGEAASGPRAMHFLSVPASALEKLLVALFYGVILFYVCYTSIFYLVDTIMVKIANSMISDRYPDGHAPLMRVINIFTKPYGAGPDLPNLYFYFMVIYINLQAAFITGSVYFPAYSFIKTCIALLVVFLFGVFYVSSLAETILPAGSFYDGFFAYRIREAGEMQRGVTLSPGTSTALKFFMMYGFLPLFWAATYFRLKEKEV